MNYTGSMLLLLSIFLVVIVDSRLPEDSILITFLCQREDRCPARNWRSINTGKTYVLDLNWGDSLHCLPGQDVATRLAARGSCSMPPSPLALALCFLYFFSVPTTPSTLTRAQTQVRARCSNPHPRGGGRGPNPAPCRQPAHTWSPCPAFTRL